MMIMIILLATLCGLLTFIGQVDAVVLTISPVAANVTVLTTTQLVQLNCSSDAPATITWNYNGNALPDNHATVTTNGGSMVSTLTLIDPDPTKSGEYGCFVPITFNTFVSTTLNIRAPIYLINPNPRISALIGNTVTMHASSLGLGRHTHQWTRRGRNVNIKEDAIGVNTVQLTLPNVTLEDAGRYFFNARSQWSNNRTRVDLSVTYPPADIIDQPQNQSTFISLSATFHCNATSPYPVTYGWRRINSTLTIREQSNTSSLVISSVRRSDEGWYQCVTSVFGVESFSAPAYLTVKELPPLQNLLVEMNLEQNEVSLNWSELDVEVFSSNVAISYGLFYSVTGVCVVSKCQGMMCKVQRRIRNRQNSVTFNQELFPFANYTWLLELTYTNNGSTIQRYNTSVDTKTSQSGASAPVNLTVLNQSFRTLNLTWGTPQCPNGLISGYRVYYNDDGFRDVHSAVDYYILTGLNANTVYNISVAAITGENNNIIGDHISIITMTALGAPVIEPQANDVPVSVMRDVARGTIEVRTPSVMDDTGNISFVYVIVSTDGLVKPNKSMASLAYLDATHSGLVYYVAAALPYNEYTDSNTFTLGNNLTTTGLNGQLFNNVKLSTDTMYYYFIRAYSIHYTEENNLVSSSGLYQVGNLSSVTANDTGVEQDGDGDDEEGFPVVIAIGVLAGLVAMIIVLVCIIVICCCYIISRNNKNRHFILRSLQNAEVNSMKEDGKETTDSEASHNKDTIQTPRAVPNAYIELQESITEKDAHQFTALLDQNNGAARAASNSPCSVTSADANENINPELGATKATITNGIVQEIDLPSQEVPQYVTTPNKESKHSWFGFHSRKKSKSDKKTAQSYHNNPELDHGNPVFDQSVDKGEETGYVEVVIENTDDTEEVPSYTSVTREATPDTKEEPGYSNITKTTADTEEMPGYGNITSELSQSKTPDNNSSDITSELSQSKTPNNNSSVNDNITSELSQSNTPDNNSSITQTDNNSSTTQTVNSNEENA